MKVNAVQGKIKCVYNVNYLDTPSAKHAGQSYSIEAGDNICKEAIKSDIFNAKVTEKIDGTCCYVQEYKGEPHLWARLDRKPNKAAMKKFKKYKDLHKKWELANDGMINEPKFTWNYAQDLKEVPVEWIPAKNVEIDPETNSPIPDDNGHVPGWVPVSQDSKTYKWHSSVINYKHKMALTLSPSQTNNSHKFEIQTTQLDKMVGKTFELIGTNVNANPYCLGTKKNPFHVLVMHGCIPVTSFPNLTDCDEIKQWFVDCDDGQIEGVVMHCTNGTLFKLHRNHLHLKWPLENNKSPLLSKSSIRYNIEGFETEDFSDHSSISLVLKFFNGKIFNSFVSSFSNG